MKQTKSPNQGYMTMVKHQEMMVVMIMLLCSFMVNKHQQPNYRGPYAQRPYDLDPVITDTIQFSTLQLVIHMVNQSRKPLFNSVDFMDSRLGDVLIIFLSMVLYHHIILPYFVVDWRRMLGMELPVVKQPKVAEETDEALIEEIERLEAEQPQH